MFHYSVSSGNKTQADAATVACWGASGGERWLYSLASSMNRSRQTGSRGSTWDWKRSQPGVFGINAQLCVSTVSFCHYPARGEGLTCFLQRGKKENHYQQRKRASIGKVRARDGVMRCTSVVTGRGGKLPPIYHKHAKKNHQWQPGDTLSQLHRLAEGIQFSLSAAHVQPNRPRSRTGKKGNRPLEGNKPAGKV